MANSKITALKKQLAAKDSLITNMKYNIKEKEKFISYLLAELRANADEKKGGENHGSD